MSTAFDGDELLREFEAAGGWLDRSLLELVPFHAMGYGARALGDIKSHTPLFHIPQALILSPETSGLRSLLSEAEWESLSGWLPLMLVMMYEVGRGQESPWFYYLKNMPSKFESPMFWSEEDLGELKGTDIFDRIGRQSAEQNYYDIILPLIQSHPDIFPVNSPHFTLDAFHVQGSRILSRSFTVPAAPDQHHGGEEGSDGDEDDIEGHVVMLPIADMLNAAYQRDNARLFSFFDDEEEDRIDTAVVQRFGAGFTMITSRDIPAGEQIYNTYNSPPNSELLRKYGHVDVFDLEPHLLDALPHEAIAEWPYGNAGDEVTIDGKMVLTAAVTLGFTDVNPTTARNDRVDAWLDGGEEDIFACTLEEPLNEDLMCFISILTSDEAWQRFAHKGKMPKAPQDDANTRMVYAEALRLRLAQYETPLQEDLQLMTELANGRRRAATIVRIGEKRILSAAQIALKKISAGDGRRTKEGLRDGPAKRQKREQ